MSKPQTSAESTHFGYKQVPAEDKADLTSGLLKAPINLNERGEQEGRRFGDRFERNLDVGVETLPQLRVMSFGGQ